jgi:ubiquinone/menaquinone biosynthesis C-methylase UbiE
MDHADHVALLRAGIPKPGGVWADFGSGKGAFTLALAELIGPDGIIYSIDKNSSALRQQERKMNSHFPGLTVHYINIDYTQSLDLPSLDGVVMANALHFQREKVSVVQSIRAYLKPRGRLILVEYNVDRGNPWVPYPLSYNAWQVLASQNGFADTRLLAKRPSRFLHEIYSAISIAAREEET